MSSLRFKKWKQYGFGFIEFLKWYGVGLSLEKSYEWNSKGFSPKTALEWIRKGRTDPTAAADYSFYLDLANSKGCGSFLLTVEKEWIQEVINFIDGNWKLRHKEYLEKIKIFVVELKVQEWSQTNLNYDEILKWRVAGFYDPTIAKSWIKEGFESHIASTWYKRGFDPRSAKGWVDKGFNPDTANSWLANNFDSGQARQYQDKGLDPTRARAAENNFRDQLGI